MIKALLKEMEALILPSNNVYYDGNNMAVRNCIALVKKHEGELTSNPLGRLTVEKQKELLSQQEQEKSCETCPMCGLKWNYVLESDKLKCYNCGNEWQPKPMAEVKAEDKTETRLHILEDEVTTLAKEKARRG